MEEQTEQNEEIKPVHIPSSDFAKKIDLIYLGDEKGRGSITCEWRICLPEGINWSVFQNVKNDTDKTVELLNGARCYIKRVNPNSLPPEYFLIIRGRGNDQRCAWCSYFRKSLTGNYNKINVGVVQHDKCVFE